MKKQLGFLAFCLLAVSCDTSSDLTPTSIYGFWVIETVYLNGENSIKYVDYLNNGGNHLNIKEDKTFGRNYDLGYWYFYDNTLILHRDESSGFKDWTYKLIELSGDKLVLERLEESQHCCNFDSFTENEIITIREVYKRMN
jgi:hypothetical protein